MATLIHAESSSLSLFRRLLGGNPHFSASRLQESNPFLSPQWNSGQFAPVVLNLTLSSPAHSIGFCPDMEPAEGEVALVVIDRVSRQRTGFIGKWTDGCWFDLDLPCACSQISVEFVSSPSWIALRAVRFECESRGTP